MDDQDNKVISFKELCDIVDNKSIDESLVGILVSGINNKLYDGLYRIIGYNHDETKNTVDLITEDCVQRAINGFGSNRDYAHIFCDARIFAEKVFYNAFDSSVKEYIKPMEVKSYYNSGTNANGTLMTSIGYGKLLSFNEIGYGISGPSKYTYAPSDVEGDLYPYFNNTTSSLRIKKYNGTAVYWWLRSRYTYYTNYVGFIDTNGNATGYNYNDAGNYLAPVIRIGSKNDDLNNKENVEKMDDQDNKVISFKELCDIIDNEGVDGSLVGTLVSDINNSLYNGLYRIIGVNHDNTNNTVDLITEDCVQQASNGFGLSNRHYDDPYCCAGIFAEDVFYNAFSDEVKECIKPMRVDYYHNPSNHPNGVPQLYIRYGKLLSYNEIGYGISGHYKYTYAPSDQEGNLYPYFNNTNASLRIKKYNGEAVNWWLRSRDTGNTNYVGYIGTGGGAYSGNYGGTTRYLAPVIRIGSRSRYNNIKEDNEMKDNVNHPAHYTDTSLECIEAMILVFGKKAVIDFCSCNAWKYVWRWKSKNGKEDLEKAKWYINKAIELNDNSDIDILNRLTVYIENELKNL